MTAEKSHPAERTPDAAAVPSAAGQATEAADATPPAAGRAAGTPAETTRAGKRAAGPRAETSHAGKQARNATAASPRKGKRTAETANTPPPDAGRAAGTPAGTTRTGKRSSGPRAETSAGTPRPRKRTRSRRHAASRPAKFALVTGASSGIGRAYALRLADQGYNIVVVSDRPGQNEAVAREVRERGVEALPLHADLAQPNAAEHIHARCRRAGIEVEVLVSNAGLLHFAQLVRTEPAAIERIVALHCTAPAMLCRLFADDMRRRGRGYILLMSSMTAWTPFPTMSLYGATKTFLKNFGRSLRHELRASGVSVTTVFPGAVDTPLYDLDPAWRRRLLRAGAMLSADELAAAGLRALFRGRSRCIPGLFAKIAIGLCRLLPDRAVTLLLHLPPVKKILEER